MPKTKPVGLLASGKITDSALARLPALTRDLGPVVATSPKLASRYANTLRAGHVAPLAELVSCRLILVQCPRAELDESLSLMLGARANWHGRTVALFSDELDSSALCAMRSRGAAACTLSLTTLPDRLLLVAEGDAAATRAVRDWCASSSIACLVLNPDTKPLYTAAIAAAATLLPPLLDATLRSLRAAGLPQPDARRIVAHVVESTIRDYQAHGRKIWINPATPARLETLRGQLASVERVDADLSTFLASSLRASLLFFGHSTDL